jgi:hypothetical protein
MAIERRKPGANTTGLSRGCACRLNVSKTNEKALDTQGMNAFAVAAPALLAAGHSPLPIVPGTKRPALAGWQAACRAPLPAEVFARFARSPTPYGVGVALGHGGLVAIDIDTEAADVLAVLRDVLPGTPVAKRGRKGATGFFFDPTRSIVSRKIGSTDGAMLVEVLATGAHSVVPPSIHPETGRPYGWLGAATLADALKLPALPPDIGDRLAAALARWTARPRRMSQPPGAGRRSIAPMADAERARQSRYVAAILAAELPSLAATGTGGRNAALFALACRIGRWVHAGLLDREQITAELIAACVANGLVSDDGEAAVRATIASALRKSEGDALPDLQGGAHD